MKRVILVAVVLLVPFCVEASHYDLGSIELVDAEIIKKLATINVLTTEDLYKATRTRSQITRLSRKLQVPASTLREWHDFCDLLRISGIGPKVARVLTLSGVKTVRQLAAQKPETLTETIKSTNAQVGLLGKLPDEDTVRNWIEQARKLIKQE